MPAAVAATRDSGNAQPSSLDPRSPRRGPNRDLYCIDLLPARDRHAHGTSELRPEPSPFGLSVNPDGSPRWNVTFAIDSQPDPRSPRSLGPYTSYIAWAATPSLNLEVKLGTVSSGLTTLGTVASDQFLLLITAERDAGVARRRGPLVLRGGSASTRMQPDDMTFRLSGMIAGGEEDTAAAPSMRITAPERGRIRVDTATDAPGHHDAARADAAPSGGLIVSTGFHRGGGHPATRAPQAGG